MKFVCRSQIYLVVSGILGAIALFTPFWVVGPTGGSAGLLQVCKDKCAWLPSSVPALDMARFTLTAGITMSGIALVTCNTDNMHIGILHRTSKLLATLFYGIAFSQGAVLRNSGQISYGLSMYAAFGAIIASGMAIVV